jgi:anti-sigma regulatory factor (Ser/Thr protein kinase)
MAAGATTTTISAPSAQQSLAGWHARLGGMSFLCAPSARRLCGAKPIRRIVKDLVGTPVGWPSNGRLLEGMTMAVQNSVRAATGSVMEADSSSQLDLSLPLDVSRLAESRQAVRAFLAASEVPQRCRNDMVLCLQEALKNAMRFSHSSRGVDVSVRVTPEGIAILVRDYGVGLDGARAALAKVPEPPDPLASSGRGLRIMATLMDDLELHSDGGVEVRMFKRLSGPEALG